MVRIVEYNGKQIKYTIIRKKVKNINLRIKPDSTVIVSANTRVTLKYIDEFVKRKGDFILKALDNFSSSDKAAVPLYTAEEFVDYIIHEYERVFLTFNKDYKTGKPQLKLKKMKSRWGSCNYVKGIIALSTNLIYCTKEQINYVIIHEFSHLLVHNHSEAFYNIIKIYCPDYKRIRKEMNKTILR